VLNYLQFVIELIPNIALHRYAYIPMLHLCHFIYFWGSYILYFDSVAFCYCAALNAGWSSQEKDVCLSIRLSNACIVTKRKKDLSRLLYLTKDHLA